MVALVDSYDKANITTGTMIGFNSGGYDVTKVAQTFTGNGYNLVTDIMGGEVGLLFYLKKFGEAGGVFYGSIYATDAETGYPTGSALITINGVETADGVSDSVWETEAFRFSSEDSLVLEDGVVYAAVLEFEDTGGGALLIGTNDTTLGHSGSFYTYSVVSEEWTLVTTEDAAFEVWGYRNMQVGDMKPMPPFLKA